MSSQNKGEEQVKQDADKASPVIAEKKEEKVALWNPLSFIFSSSSEKATTYLYHWKRFSFSGDRKFE